MDCINPLLLRPLLDRVSLRFHAQPSFCFFLRPRQLADSLFSQGLPNSPSPPLKSENGTSSKGWSNSASPNSDGASADSKGELLANVAHWCEQALSATSAKSSVGNVSLQVSVAF